MVKEIAVLCILSGMMVYRMDEGTIQVSDRVGILSHKAVEEVVEYDTPDEIEEIKISLEKKLRNVEQAFDITSQIQVLDLQYRKGSLLVDLSRDIISYGGGNEAEYQVISSLLMWAFEEVLVDKITLLVEGDDLGFPEGTQILAFTKDNYQLYCEGR